MQDLIERERTQPLASLLHAVEKMDAEKLDAAPLFVSGDVKASPTP